MSPLVESGKHLYNSKELDQQAYYFVVDLDSDSEIDVMAFDAYAKSLTLNLSPQTRLKFLVSQTQSSVEGNNHHAKMYVFDPKLPHAEFYKHLQETNGLQELFSAGFIDLTSDSGFGFVMTRNLTGYSESLEKIFGLEREKSNTYRKKVLRQKLGKYFTATNEALTTSSPVL